jgi:hypothetical protein
MHHIDDDWVHKKINGHGGAFLYSSSIGLMHIDYIGSTSRIKVFGYNVILFFKYLKRMLLLLRYPIRGQKVNKNGN